jgi:hypothetical protein
MRATIQITRVGDTVVVLDQNGAVSVTNDIDAVVKHLIDGSYIRRSATFVYRDSQGEFDGVLVTDRAFQGFIHLGAGDAQTAVSALRAKGFI